MKKGLKITLVIILTPIILVAGYIGFLWATYIDESIISGTGYGFEISSTKQQVYKKIETLASEHPNLNIYVNYGQRAGDFFILPPTSDNFKNFSQYNRWDVLLDGKGEFFNTIDFHFKKNKLIKIYRHRQYFELP